MNEKILVGILYKKIRRRKGKEKKRKRERKEEKQRISPAGRTAPGDFQASAFITLRSRVQHP